MKKPSEYLMKCYNLGVKLSNKYNDIQYAWINEEVEELMGFASNSDNDYLFFVAGFNNAEIPTWVSGWRYGKAPENGKSHNYKDDKPEMGVSMMEVITQDKKTLKTQDEISKLFIITDNREVYKYEGWLNTVKRGSDGEPLLYGVKEV